MLDHLGQTVTLFLQVKKNQNFSLLNKLYALTPLEQLS